MITIAEAQAADIPAIVELWKEFMDFHSVRDPFFTRKDDGHTSFAGHIEKSIASDESQVLVARDGDRVVAYSLSHIANYPPVLVRTKYGMISDTAVTEGYRRKGIGELLLREIRDWFVRKGIVRMEGRVAATNEVAQSFWRKQGFTDCFHVMFLEL